MDAQFWHERWAINQIGFNQSTVNSYLVSLWPELKAEPNARVLVPLCGKSIDMAWLAAQGHPVVGVELSHMAAEDYFKERGVQPVIEQRGAFTRYSHCGVEIWCGDFFALKAADIGKCTALYDRAALIALPAEMRWRYVEHVNCLLDQDACGLLITLDYDQSVIEGPPFAVNEDEVQQLLSPQWRVRQAGEWDVLGQSPKFKQAGARWLKECAYRMFRR